jgi:hypothetical protein
MTRRRLESAKTIISGTKYLAEHTFLFEKYVTALKAAFETLPECEEGMTANAQVYTLLEILSAQTPKSWLRWPLFAYPLRCSRASPTPLTRLAKLSRSCSRTRKASSRNNMLLPSRRTERAAAAVAEEAAEAGEAEAAGAVVVVEAGR